MAANEIGTVAALVGGNEATVLSEWLALQSKTGVLETGRISESELKAQSENFLRALREALAQGGSGIGSHAYQPVKTLLDDLSRSRAMQGFSPSETATFVFSLKQPLFNTLNSDKSLSPKQVVDLTWAMTLVIDELGYVPSAGAVGLARGRTRIVGMLVPSLTWAWMGEGSV